MNKPESKGRITGRVTLSRIARILVVDLGLQTKMRVLAGIMAVGLISSMLLVQKPYADDRSIGELTKGQWAEGRVFDPFGERPVLLWLPEGTLIYDITRHDRVRTNPWKYRFATTYHGYPVNLKLEPEQNRYLFRERGPSQFPKQFRLTKSVLCLWQTPLIVWPATKCNHGQMMRGEGWTFDFQEAETSPPELPKYNVVAYLDKATADQVFHRNLDDSTADEFGRLQELRFDLYKRDVERFERLGVLFRLDRRHPLSRFHFLGNNYFPCGSTRSTEIRAADMTKAVAEAGIGVEFKFFGWLATVLGGKVTKEKEASETTITVTKIRSEISSVFQQWGIVELQTGPEPRHVPFSIQKKFECQVGTGTNDPGKRILEVKVKFFNRNEGRDDTYTFDDPSDWMAIDKKLYAYIDRPVFFSVNEPSEQLAVITGILDKHKTLSFSQALFIFAQLNNTCNSTHRDVCQQYAKAAP